MPHAVLVAARPRRPVLLRAIRRRPRSDYGGDLPDEDEQLFAAAAAGSSESLEMLLELYLPQLHAYVRARLGGDFGPREASADIAELMERSEEAT